MAAFWRGPMSTTPREDRMPGSSQPMRKPAAQHNIAQSGRPTDTLVLQISEPSYYLTLGLVFLTASAETIRERGYTWPALFTTTGASREGDGGDGAESAAAEGGAVEGIAAPVHRVWTHVDDDEEEAEAAAAREGAKRAMPHYEKCFQGF
jgi:hypothetical protein